ncbi:MAG: serine/threonine protein kinase, partial [Akkermansia sp.]
MPIAPGRAAARSIESPIDDGNETRLSTPAPVVVGRATDDNDETRLSSPAAAALSGADDDSDETRLNTPTPVVVAGKPTDDGDETRMSSPATAALSGTDDDETHLGAPDINTHSTPVADKDELQPEPLPSGGTAARQTETELPAGGVHLPIGFMLRDYKITRLLGQGGFGVTYLAQDTTLDEDVVIKENLPTAISNRNTTTFCVQALTRGTGPGSYEWALNNFLNEAKILRKLKHPNIIEIITAFREMGTAYYVMPYISGTSLDKTLDKTSRPMPEAEIRSLLVPLLDALEYLHSLKPILLHRDIKPANILRKPDGSPILIDFGTARILTEHSQTSIESPGYTPIEQLQTHGNLGPWTDIYALGATMYHLITGTKPMKVNDRMGRRDVLIPLPLAGRPELQKDYSPQLLLSVDKAMALWPEDRWQ